MTRAEPMKYHRGWNYETPCALFQLWPPDPEPRGQREPRTEWSAAWTERRQRESAYYLDDDDDGWRPDGDFNRGATAEEALRCFPTNDEAERAKQALLAVSQI